LPARVTFYVWFKITGYSLERWKKYTLKCATLPAWHAPQEVLKINFQRLGTLEWSVPL